MGFQDQEGSVEEGQPIELFRFSNLEEQFFYTSGQREIVFNSETYLPRSISRTDPDRNNLETRATLVVKMANTDPFARRYVQNLPPTPDQAVVYRRHSTDGTDETIVLFKGQVENVAFTGNEAKVNIVSTANLLSKPIPRQTMRNLCNHVLYDARCAVTEGDFSMDTTVTQISSDGLFVNVDGGSNTIPATGLNLGDQLSADSAYFNAGVLSRNGLEQRMVLSTIPQAGNEAVMSILVPFQNLQVGTTLTLLAGCDHKFGTCRNKFDNSRRYGGFPYVPRKNPFSAGVDR